MNNAAIICPIKNVRPHPNADRVQLGTACGYQVVIGLDIKEGDLGIYFPTDTCLGKDFAAANKNLLTYFGKNLRVRTQKFRGEKSEGFWAEYDSFARCFDPVTHAEAAFHEGDEITTYRDSHISENIEICKKYVNPATLNRRNLASKIAKKFRTGSLPTFQKHMETEHLRKEWDKIPRDRQWIWTVKQHGTCLTGRARIRMANGSIKRMKDVVIGDVVASKDGPAEVLDTMIYEPAERWVRIDAYAGHGERSKLTCTPDHLVWTDKGWVEADDLDPTVYKIAVSKMAKTAPYVWFTDNYKVEPDYEPHSGMSKKRYDIETTTHSFIANNVVVHNSQRLGYVLVPQSFFARWAAKFRKAVPIPCSKWRDSLSLRNFTRCKKLLDGMQWLQNKASELDDWWNKNGSKLRATTNRYEYVVGSRNVILGELKADGSVGKDNFYSDEFRKQAATPFIGQLRKGEVVYYEIVGYAAYNSPIMPTVHPKDKDIKKLYGTEVTYTYGCANGSFDIYVYRIAYQTEEGQSIDLSWDQVKARCGELGVKHVPEVDSDVQALWNSVEHPIDLIQDYIEQPDPVDGRHPMEGVVLRVEGSKPSLYKEKAFTFKVLEGIAADQGAVDTEEAS